MKIHPFRISAAAPVAAVTFLLAGCASFSPDGGFEAVERLSRERIGHTPTYQRTAEQGVAAGTRVAELLARPLSADGAVEIALLNQRELQAAYAELGIAEADLVRAARPANPTLSFGRLTGSGGVEIERALLFDVLGLFTLPLATELGQQRLQQAQLQAAYETVGVATEARKAFFEALAAQQLLGYYGQVQQAAGASSELARRMQAAGNFNALAQLREQAFHADATLNLARAQQRALAARERLVRALGLSEVQLGFTLPERLPELPAAPAAPQATEQAALDRRLDLLMARRSTEATAQALGLTKATRFINVLQLGYQNKSESGAARSNGYQVELELPLFDFGSARLARAEAVYMQSLHRTAAVAARAGSETREAHAAYRSAYELARQYRDEIVPLRKRISEENLLRYNGMLASVFDLLADAREQIAGVVGAVEAQRDFWIAETELQATLAGRAASGAGPAPAAIATGPAAAH
ncbi:TolC family protein [Roseateles violae]|uniref:TolC family protein n=1 Tax=Roseateles violae TaxID=3058042 RepID=A0ABT8DVE9_9BURK|nr:TolC family protein [Pelomonas sp. PFR6]MDN3920357.1 TolC family protein [Pelomonas sp. PFR6]